MDDNETVTETLSAAYTCPRCGSWVPFGVYHACFSLSSSGNDHLAAVLERIADALERLADRSRLTW